ncbi:hypothetical protein F5Y14DRAFT_462216 [Nemania sp. NC0429]|nr:hypothetical protein F5Y14DRAFT_462216 [Nemania sp. NC0429]
MNWTAEVDSPGTPYKAPDVETPSSKSGNTPKFELAVWIVVGLATSLVALRITYHVLRGRRRLWSDDYFLIVALACLIGNGVTIQEWLPYKFEPNLTAATPAGYILTGSLMGLFNSLALALSKTSLGITFMRLTSGMWKFSLGVLVFVIDLLFVVQAWSYWVADCADNPEPFRVQNECVYHGTVASFRLAVQALSCTLDIYFTLLPWKIVRPLQLKRFEKIGLGIAMSFGFASLSCVYAVGGYLYNFLEPGFSIIAACMPILRKVVKDMIEWNLVARIPKWFALLRRKKRTSDSESVLPLSKDPEDSSSSLGKTSSEKTDTTLAPTISPVT